MCDATATVGCVLARNRPLKSMMNENSLWNLDNVSVQARSHFRLRNLSLTIPSGRTAIIGNSGAGKTSLLNLLAKFEQPTSGTLQHIVDIARTSFSLPMAWVPQDHGLWPHLTALQHLEAMEETAARSQSQRRNASDWLRMFELHHRKDERPARLSQGERARLSVARCLAANASVLLMDEPLAHVDSARVMRFWEIVLQHCANSGCSLVFTSHRSETVLASAQTAICLDDGQAVWQGAVSDLYFRPESESLANFLGESNWFDAGEVGNWLEIDGQSADNQQSVTYVQNGRCCLRPEQLRMVANELGELSIVEMRFLGSVTETMVSHPSGEQRRIFHRAASEFSVGDRVSLKVVPNIAKWQDE